MDKQGFYCSLLSLDLTTITGEFFRLCDAPFDVVYEGNVYRAMGSLLSIDKLTTDNTLSSKELQITLSGVAIDFQESINNNLFRRRPIVISKAFVPDGGNTVTVAKTYWRGFGSTPETEIVYDENQSYLNIILSCKSMFDLDQTPSLMRSNNSTHQAYHNGDRFFEYAVVDLGDDVMWRE